MNFFRKRMNKKGFTLIELIIVIAILGILAALAIPRFFGFTESAKQTADEEIANIVANAAILYYASEGGVPSIADLDTFDYIEKTYTADDLTSDKYSDISLDPDETVGDDIILSVTLTGDPDDYVVTK